MNNYKWLAILTLLLWVPFSSIQAKEKDETVAYRVTRSDYTFSTVFDMANEKHSLGNVIKSVFHLTTHYDAYNRFGLYEGQGVCRLFCLGLIYSWATEIDVYNAEGRKIGMIDGQVVSAEPAKFSFYNSAGNRIAIGYLDKNRTNFNLVDPDNSALVIARLSRNFILDTVDNWDIVIYYPDRISSKMVKIFGAFVCDTQNTFKTDL